MDKCLAITCVLVAIGFAQADDSRARAAWAWSKSKIEIKHREEAAAKTNIQTVASPSLYLNLPDDAILWINDQPMSNSGAFRKYEIPPITEPGVYRIKATSRGKTVTKTVTVEPGKDVHVDLRNDFGFELEQRAECHCPQGCPCPGRAGTGKCDCHVQPVPIQSWPALPATGFYLQPYRGSVAISGRC